MTRFQFLIYPNEHNRAGRELQYSIFLAHLIFGPALLVFNAFVCMLIVLDIDTQGKVYRKYLFSLQFFATSTDAYMSAITPIMQFNCRLIYHVSNIGRVFGTETCIMIYSFLFFGVIFAYFMCVYYRRNILLNNNRLFCFHGWKYSLFIAMLVLLMFIVLIAAYFVVESLRTPITEIPSTIEWVKRKISFLVISSSRLNYPALLFAIGSAFACGTIILMMVYQLIREVNNGMVMASVATKRYHTRVVFSLIMQGCIPSVFFVVPLYYLLGLLMNSFIIGLEEAANNRFVLTIAFYGSIFSINFICSLPKRDVAARIRPFHYDYHLQSELTKNDFKDDEQEENSAN